MKAFLFILISVFSSCFLQGQSYLGSWTSYLPYNSGSKIAIADEKIYCSTNGGLFYYNRFDKSLNKLSKENGLSDSDISALGFSENTGTLLIAYKNANLDLIVSNRIYNIPDIMRKQIMGDKTIYSISFREKLAYLACGFGIVVLDIENRQIIESYDQLDNGESLKILDIAFSDQIIYAATAKGLYTADLNQPNLIDFRSWLKDPRFPPSTTVIQTISALNNEVFLSARFAGTNSDTLFYKTGNNWLTYPYLQSSRVPYIEVLEEGILICSRYHVDLFDRNGGNPRHIGTGNPIMAAMDEMGDLWIADFTQGMIHYPHVGYPETLIPEGPAGITTFDLEYRDEVLLCVPGGATSSWNNLYRPGEVYRLEDNNWENWRADSIKDILKIKIDPFENGHYFAASWGYGLLEFSGNELTQVYLENNSSLQSVIPGQPFIRLGGLSFDKMGNLWVTNSGVSNSISVRNREGEWFPFELSAKIDAPNLGDIIVTQQNHKWIILNGGKGLFVFDENESFDDFKDDRSKKLSIYDKNNDIITNEVYSIAEDRDGNIWVGTNQGPLVYYSPYRVFDETNFYAQQIIIPRNDGSGLGDPLLGSESISCIAVDGANRKWLGTKDGGLFLVSEDGLRQIKEFNITNSPLLSNSIIDIAIADETGEVFIATENGIISYIGDATSPSETFTDVFVFPNPVRENYEGEIVISGLVENSNVKITDLNGNLVSEIKSLGGQAIWDGKNFQGKRVATGIYLVFCSSEDGQQSFVTKLMFIH